MDSELKEEIIEVLSMAIYHLEKAQDADDLAVVIENLEGLHTKVEDAASDQTT
tara:strand:- start:529 stop:687 length:159 start_codon:yes stop_codon:yes gene_type:complete